MADGLGHGGLGLVPVKPHLAVAVEQVHREIHADADGDGGDGDCDDVERPSQRPDGAIDPRRHQQYRRDGFEPFAHRAAQSDEQQQAERDGDEDRAQHTIGHGAQHLVALDWLAVGGGLQPRLTERSGVGLELFKQQLAAQRSDVGADDVDQERVIVAPPVGAHQRAYFGGGSISETVGEQPVDGRAALDGAVGHAVAVTVGEVEQRGHGADIVGDGLGARRAVELGDLGVVAHVGLRRR